MSKIKTYFQAKARYQKNDDTTGKETTVTDKYLVDAVSWTEAESRITAEMQQIVSGDFSITKIDKTRIEECHKFNEDGIYYICKIAFLDVSEVTGKEKKTRVSILVNSTNIDEVKERVDFVLSKTLIQWELESIGDSQIKDVFEYEEDNRTED